MKYAIKLKGVWKLSNKRPKSWSQEDPYLEDKVKDFVKPLITETQKLGSVLIYDSEKDVITYDIIELTSVEIAAKQKALIPFEVSNVKFRLSLIKFGIMPNTIDLDIDAIVDPLLKENVYTLWNFANFMEREDRHLNEMASGFNITQSQLDNIFIEATKL